MQMEKGSILRTTLDCLRNAANDENCMSYADFVQIAAFDPQIGYYSKIGNRVGRSPEADFYTTESLGQVFGKLVSAGAVDMLGSEKAAGQHVFVEIGAEPGKSVLDEINHPFPEILTLRLGDSLDIPEKAFVFANEWLDSLPFHRLRFNEAEGWQELGVKIEEESLREVILPEMTDCVTAIKHRLPATSSQDYRLDLPLRAVDALRVLAKQKWQGAFLTFDYGKSWEELIHNHPAGTARAYRNHQSHSNLLTDPGEIDLTCSLCWDLLTEVLWEQGFKETSVERQESFLMKRSSAAIRKIVEKQTTGLDEERQTLHEILHPSLMGDCFQALSATRLKPSAKGKKACV